jgi:hypothetical protein
MRIISILFLCGIFATGNAMELSTENRNAGIKKKLLADFDAKQNFLIQQKETTAYLKTGLTYAMVTAHTCIPDNSPLAHAFASLLYALKRDGIKQLILNSESYEKLLTTKTRFATLIEDPEFAQICYACTSPLQPLHAEILYKTASTELAAHGFKINIRPGPEGLQLFFKQNAYVGRSKLENLIISQCLLAIHLNTINLSNEETCESLKEEIKNNKILIKKTKESANNRSCNLQ